MKFFQIFQDVAFWLGIGFSLLWSSSLATIAPVQKLELQMQDFVMRSFPPQISPQEIVLVKIRQNDLNNSKLFQDPYFYSNLANRLLEEGAAVVILNLQSNWVQTTDHVNHPIKELVQNHPDRLVLVIPTTSASLPNPTTWRPYNYFIPLNSEGQPLFPINTILGFSEYEPEEYNPSSLNSPARQANLTGNFIFSNNLYIREKLDAAVWLGLKKFQSQQKQFKLTIDHSQINQIQVNFWSEDRPLTSLDVQEIVDNQTLKQVRNKIILVGIAELEDPNSFPLQSPFGKIIANVEFQANFLASLLSNSFYRLAPIWMQEIVIILVAVPISKVIVKMMLKPKLRIQGYQNLAGIMMVSLGVLIFIGFWYRVIFPVILSLLTWLATAFSIMLAMMFGRQEILIEEQQGEIARLKSIEQEAVISQARKLLNRIYAQVHDGPFQELKLIMDSLEMLQLEHSNLDIDPILKQLESLGNHLRQHLHQAHSLSLQLTPELRAGLAVGIQKKLEELVNSNQLTLKVEAKLQSLKEPTLNSLWLSAREEIFIFFCEAVTNTIKHSQPPHGTATYLKVNLSQQGYRCMLRIENDGLPLNKSVLETPSSQRSRGGYGTKLMQNIASDLPEGSLNRIYLREGGMLITLTWKLLF